MIQRKQPIQSLKFIFHQLLVPCDFIIKTPIILFFIMFGGVCWTQARQGYEWGKLPEQFQYFKRYVRGDSAIIDDLGVPVRITCGTCVVESKTDAHLKFTFGIQG
eukprot:805882_1